MSWTKGTGADWCPLTFWSSGLSGVSRIVVEFLQVLCTNAGSPLYIYTLFQKHMGHYATNLTHPITLYKCHGSQGTCKLSWNLRCLGNLVTGAFRYSLGQPQAPVASPSTVQLNWGSLLLKSTWRFLKNTHIVSYFREEGRNREREKHQWWRVNHSLAASCTPPRGWSL